MASSSRSSFSRRDSAVMHVSRKAIPPRQPLEHGSLKDNPGKWKAAIGVKLRSKGTIKELSWKRVGASPCGCPGAVSSPSRVTCPPDRAPARGCPYPLNPSPPFPYLDAYAQGDGKRLTIFHRKEMRQPLSMLSSLLIVSTQSLWLCPKSIEVPGYTSDVQNAIRDRW